MTSGISINAMRRIDRIVGVPLCLVATALLKLRSWLRSRPPRSIRRILFVELSEMGSVILANPAMRKARARTGAELYFVIFGENSESIALTDSVAPDNVFTIGTTSIWRLAIDTAAFLFWVRRNGIDTVIDLELFSRYTALLTGLSGADRRVGFYRFYNEGLYRGEMLTHRVAYNPHIHIAKNFIALVEATLSPTPTIPYAKAIIGDDELTVPVQIASKLARDNLQSRINKLFSRYEASRFRLVLINANSSEMLPQRRWMAERFAELIQRILATNNDVLVLLTGAPNERAEAEELAARCANDRCIAFAGHTSIRDLLALYSLAEVIVTNDSGPAHFAAAAGLPTIVLFGPETPKLYRPLGNSIAIYAGLACSPCVSAANHRQSPCTDNACMRAISADEVFRAVSAILTTPMRASTKS